MSFPTKNSRFAVVVESTEGTPVSPTSGANFIALREGFDFDYAIDEEENNELSGSIGKSKSILGLENPSLSSDSYLRHSGIEATEPDQGPIYHSAFGAKSIRAIERDVVASTAGNSTTAATITVGAGEGVEFQVGDALLIKDGANAYDIRNVESIAGDILTLNFNLDFAPAAAVLLGRNVLYKPANSGHPTLTAWLYRANEADVEMASGMRVVDLSITAEAGGLIESAYSLEGVEGFYNPIEITASTDSLDVTDDGGAFTITLPTGFYKDPHDAAQSLQDKLNASGSDVFTVVFSDATGKFTVSSDGGVTLDIDWASTANTLGAKFGFTADDTGFFSYVSDIDQDYSSPYTPTFDASNPLTAKNNHVTLGDFADKECFSLRSIDFTIANAKEDKLDICAPSGKSGTIVESREVTVEVVANIPQHDADKFKRFRTNQTTKFMWNFGTKSGGNWEAGKSGNIYMKTATISAFKVGDEAGQVTLEMTLTGFVDSGASEVFLNFV